MISRATVSNVPAYPKKLPTVLIASLATLVLMSGLVLTRELLDGSAGGTMGVPVGRARRQSAAGADFDAAAERVAQRPIGPDSLAARLRSVVKGKEPAPVGVPVSAIEEFAHNLHQVGVAGSQMAFFGAAADLDTGAVAIRFARALARDARVVLVGLGSGDAAIRDISSDPNAPGLAELAAGSASFGDIITKDRASGLNLIASARDGAMRNGLMSVPGMSKNFDALAYSYAHVVIDAGGLRGRDMEAVARIAPHAILLVDTTSSVAATKARDSLMDVGFNNVTLLVAGHADSEGPAASRFSAAAA